MDDMQDHALLTGHSTTVQAATIAQKAEVGKLIIGHYSSRYENLDFLLEEAQTVFPKTILGIDGATHHISPSIK